MNVLSALIWGAAGLAAGWFIPQLAQKIMHLKEYPDDGRPIRLWHKIVCLLVSGGCLAILGGLSQQLLQIILLAFIVIAALTVTVIDLRVRRIPNESVALIAVVGLTLHITVYGLSSLIPALLSMAAVMILFIVLGVALGLETIGAGDVKLAGAIGLVLGWPYVIYGMLAMSALLLVFSIGGMLTKKITLKSMVAFAPFLMGGTLVAVIASVAGG